MRETEVIYAYGRHAIQEALKAAPQAVEEVFLAPDTRDEVLGALLRKAKVKVSSLQKHGLPRGVDPQSIHQGIVARISLNRLVRPYKSFLDELVVTPDTALVVLAELQDPQNVGAAIRTAAAFGAAAVLVPERNQAPISGTVVKVSAGMAFQVPIVEVVNVNTALRDLKEKGFWIYGLDGEGDHSLHTEVFDAPAVFVVGNEADGIREKTKETCDIVLTIPMHARCESLNAAASLSATLYAWSAQHPGSLI